MIIKKVSFVENIFPCVLHAPCSSSIIKNKKITTGDNWNQLLSTPSSITYIYTDPVVEYMYKRCTSSFLLHISTSFMCCPASVSSQSIKIQTWNYRTDLLATEMIFCIVILQSRPDLFSSDVLLFFLMNFNPTPPWINVAANNLDTDNICVLWQL